MVYGTSSGWSDTVLSVWGKSSDREAQAWLPLVQHLTDSADVAGLVWGWLPPNVRQAIEKDLPETGRDGRTLLRWLAGVHDVGKCSPPFAAKMPVLAARMRDHGLVLPVSTADFGRATHGLVGHVLLQRWLKEMYDAGARVARTYAVIVGGHHGVPPTSEKVTWLKDRPHLLGDGEWRRAQVEILDGMAAYTGADRHLAAWAGSALTPTAQALLTGGVIVSDWLASNVDLFPFDSSAGAARAELAWKELGLPDHWSPAAPPLRPDDHLTARFPHLGATTRPVQQLAVEVARGAATAPLVIVESTMGSGKTEAALMAAEVLAERFGAGGLFLGLPTMATADGIFARIVDWIGHLDGDGATSINLAHGKSDLNDDYQSLHRRRLADIHDEDHPPARVRAEVQAWLTGRKKKVLASMVVGTVDQLLFMALQAKHVTLRHLGLAGKVVIVDEVHAADDYMRMYLCRALEWLAAYEVPVVLLSATLPSSQREELVNGYRAGLGLTAQRLAAPMAYPMITSVSTSGTEFHTVDAATTPTRVELRCIEDDTGDLVALLEEWLVDGGCVGVICNTVGRAQEAAKALRERYGSDVVLVHSRFIATHRAEREAELRAELGRDGARRPLRRIVVGTQVLEQSLDVDFDAMVTDLAPTDLVLQRLGRLHRHVRRRPERLAVPRAAIRGVQEWSEDGPVPARGATVVYGDSRLLRAAAVMGLAPATVSTLTLPDEVRPKVEAAYAAVFEAPPGWAERVRAADDRHEKKTRDARVRADGFRLRSLPELEGHLVGLLEDSSADAEDPRCAPRVRDTEDGLEVIVVQRDDGVVRFIADGSEHAGRVLPVDLGDSPEDRIARSLAAVTVRLPIQMTAPYAFEATLDALEAQGHEGWQSSRWLAGQLVLHLDTDWNATVGEFDLHYDQADGLVVIRKDIDV
ncbi:CRISPR-associated helicase Cas3' [Nocardioides sp. NPDC101246]|uniref:CRISPR-associated helicase Cas3' n=1 Tax=Nocardioides sp. NPDC101246 TaxID=3364336 RepID=UPI0038161D4A